MYLYFCVEYIEETSPEKMTELADHFEFTGTVGDQDWITLLGNLTLFENFWMQLDCGGTHFKLPSRVSQSWSPTVPVNSKWSANSVIFSGDVSSMYSTLEIKDTFNV